MTITERLMKPGSFSIRLREDYPWSVAAAVDVFDHIVVTPGRLDATTDLSDATILATAIYTGVVVAKPSPRIFEGAGLAWWLGTDEGLGDVLDVAVTQTAASLSTWISALLPGSLTLGTVSNTGLGTHTGTYQWVTRREAIDAVCRALGAEWRINPNKTFDAAKAPNLFVSSPTTVITRREEGQDGGYRGLDGSMIVTSKDVRQYTTKAIVVAAGAGVSVATGSSTGTTAYRDGNNNLVVLERLVNAPSDPSTSASAIAAAVVGQWNQVRRELSLSSRTYNVTRHVRPGDYVYVFDQLAELTDSANQITARADLITPIKLRVHALTWPAQLGMGVYARRSTGSDYTYTDLTDHVEWETSDVTWDVGAAPRASNDVDAKLAGTTAYLGANAAVAERASTAGAVLSYTPALTATTTNPNIGSTAIAEGEYQVVNGRCSGRGTIYANGAGITSGTGLYRVSLPYPARSLPGTSLVAVGHGSVYLGAPSPGVNPVTLDVSPGASTARLIGPGFEAGSTTGGGGIGLAGNAIWFQFDYPIA